MSFMLFVGAAGANNAGYLTAGSQTIAGIKTFTSRTKHLVAADAAVEFGNLAGYGYLSGGSVGAILGWGAYHDGTSYVASQTTASMLIVNPTLTQFTLDTGLTAGNSFTPTQVFAYNATGMIIGTGTPSARLTLPPGTATAGSAPLKLQTGTVMTTPEAGAVEMNSGSLFYTPSSTRERIFTGPALVSTTINPGAISNGTVWESSDIAVPNAAVNEPVLIGPPAAVEAGLVWAGYVASAGNVRIRIGNLSGGSVTPASATWKVTVLH